MRRRPKNHPARATHLAQRWLARPAALLLAMAGAFVATSADAFDRGEPACRPEMAQARPLVTRASLKPDEVKLSFVGHSTFVIETPKGVTVATDYNDYLRPPSRPDIITMNRAHSTHYSNNPEAGIRHILRGWDPGGGRAEHDLTDGDLRIRNIITNIRDWNGATIYNGNSIFVFEIGELCIGHLGHLHHVLEPEHLRAIGRLDVVLAPVDGNYTLDQDGMMAVLKTLQARLIIPMHYFGPGTLGRFLDAAAPHFAVERRDSPELVVSKAGLPSRPTVIVLPGR